MCQYCIDIFPDMGKLKDHYENVHPEAPYSTYKCELCNELNTTSLEKIQKHYENEHQEIFHPYTCQLCGSGFVLIEDYFWHEIEEHNITREKYKCLHCPNIYTSKRLFTVHQVRFFFLHVSKSQYFFFQFEFKLF